MATTHGRHTKEKSREIERVNHENVTSLNNRRCGVGQRFGGECVQFAAGVRQAAGVHPAAGMHTAAGVQAVSAAGDQAVSTAGAFVLLVGL